MIDWKARDDNKLVVGVLTFMTVTLIAVMTLAGGLRVSFTGSRFQGSSLNDRDTVAEYHGTVDASNNLLDMSGANNLQWAEEFDNVAWTKSNVTVTADQVRGPKSWTTNADLLTPGAADSYVYQDDTGGAAGETHTCSFELRSVTGNVSLSIHLYNQAHGAIRATETITVTPHWRRYSVQGTLVAGDTAAGCTIGGNNAWSTGENVYAVRGQSQENDGWRTGAGIYHYTDATTKPVLDLAPTNGPTSAKTTLQNVDGNKLEARSFDGTGQFYNIAHHASLSVWDGDSTLTIMMKKPDSVMNKALFCHGTYGSGGIYVETRTDDTIRAVWSDGVGGVNLYSTATVVPGYDHIVQIVRDNNSATIYVDGTASGTLDTTGYGVDFANMFYVGAYTGGASPYLGEISYTAIRSKALSLDELAQEREMLQGLTSNWSAVNAFEFTRATTAMKIFSAGGAHPMVSHMSEVVANHPRVSGKGGGVLIEGQSTNICLQSEDFNTTWTAINVTTVSVDALIALDGTITTDGFIADAANVSHGRRQNITLTADIYTFSAYLKQGNKTWARLHDTTVANAFAYFDLANCTIGTVGAGATAGVKPMPDGYCRCWITFTGIAAVHSHRIFSAEADNDTMFAGDGVTVNTYAWGAQVEELSFPSSYIPTLVSPVTQIVDDLTFDPHPAGTNQFILPEYFSPTGAAMKLTVYLETKCQWSSSVDIGEDRYLLEISGNGGTASDTRNRFQIYVASNGKLYAGMRDDASTNHYSRTAADVVPYNEWFSVRAVFDFSDFSRQDLWVNESNVGMAFGNNSGTGTFDTVNTLIRVGQYNTSGINSFCRIRNLMVTPSETRP